MKKNKLKLVFIMALAIVAFPVQASASNGVAWVSQNGKPDNTIEYDNGKHYQDYHINVRYNNKDNEAYCVDFGMTMGGGNDVASVTCQEISSPALSYVLNDPNASHKVKQLASRVIAQQIGIAQTNHQVVSSNGTMDQVNALLTNANNYAGGAGGKITFTKAGGRENTVNYSLYSPVALQNVTFECSNCQINSQNWNGTTGSISVTVTNGCDFTIIAKYDGNGNNVQDNNVTTSKVIYCSGSGNIQGTVFTINGTAESNGTTSGNNSGTSVTGNKVTQTFKGTIDASTGGNYYKKYCDGNKEDKCTQKTDIQVPSYCDDAGEEKITITAPKDVKYCILNHSDEAGNTYQMLDGQVSENNPYCAVFCKEDYEITMPGARYSDSGRYFNLTNTVVNAKRTCYTGNPTGDTETTNINIEKFIADVTEAQKNMINAADAYQKAIKEKELAANATPQYDSGCNGTKIGPHYEIKSSSYNGWAATCNTKTGVCTPNAKTGTTEGRVWGTTGSCERTCSGHISDNGNGGLDCFPDWSESNKTSTNNYDFEAAVATAKNNMIAARNNLIQMIKHMEECYGWKNELCLNPDVFFQYDEQYTGSINYEQIYSNISKDVSTGYSQNKTIDNAYTTTAGGNLENHNYAYCDENGCNTSNEVTAAEKISTLVNHVYHMKKESTGEAAYNNQQQFQTNYPHGTIDTVSDPSNIRYNYSYLGTVFPIALNTPTGVYNWNLNFSKLGQYNQNVGCNNGRLDDVAKALGKSTTAGLQYVCVYVVDCPDCDYECLDPSGNNCIIPDPKPQCPDCDVYCTNCIFDGDESTFFWRIIGSEVNPSGRPLGNNLTNEKGKETIKEIEETGENVYKEAQYVYRLDATTMKAIRDYNKETGTYVAEDLQYHDMENVPNAYGTSTFLDEGKRKGFFEEIKRNKTWTLWSGEKNSNTGPAWK